MEIRHVLGDSDYFLLIELKLQGKEVDSESKTETTPEKDPNRAKNLIFKIHKKVHLRNVESLVDRSEPRNLIVGIVSEKGDGNDINEEMLLYFDNANKCTYVKNMIDMKKQSQRKRVVNTVKKYLEDCVIGNVVASTNCAL
jgi:hypothetical protein